MALRLPRRPPAQRRLRASASLGSAAVCVHTHPEGFSFSAGDAAVLLCFPAVIAIAAAGNQPVAATAPADTSERATNSQENVTHLGIATQKPPPRHPHNGYNRDH